MNSTQIFDAAVAAPGVAWGWFLGLNLGLKLTFLCAVFGAYPVVIHISNFFKGSNKLDDSQNLAEKLYEDLKQTQVALQLKDEEIKALKEDIDGLREAQKNPEEKNYAARAEAELANGKIDLAKAFSAEEAAKHLKAGDDSYLKEAPQTLQSKDEEIKALKDAIDGLREAQKNPEEKNYAARAEAELANGKIDLAKAFSAEEAAKHLKAGDDSYLKEAPQTLQSKDEEIKALKDAIDGLREAQKNPKEKNHAARAEAELANGKIDLAKAFYAEEAAKHLKAGDDSYLKAAEALRRKGALDYMNNPAEAMKAYQKSVELDPKSADGWNQLGLLHHLLGNLKLAGDAFNEVLQLSNSDKSIKAVAYGNLGVIRKTQGDLEGAEDFYLKALEIDKELGSKEGMAADYGNLGVIRDTQGDLEGAEELYLKALEIDKELGRKEGMAIRYGNLGLIRDTQGDLEGAEELYLKALEIDKELGRKEGMAIRYGNLGLIRAAQGDLEGAEEFYNKALKIGKELGSKERIAIQYGNLGIIRKTQGDLEGAEEFYLKALEIDKELERKEGMAIRYGNLGLIRATQGDLEGAEEFYNKALKIGKELGSKERIAIQYGNLGVLREIRNDLKGAEDYWQQSLALYKQIGAAPMIEKIQGWLDELEANKDN